MDKITKVCDECYGSGDGVSKCCMSDVYDRRCSECGKFVKVDVCYSCMGYGSYDINLGDDVSIYVSNSSPEYLKKQFAKIYKDGYIYRGRVLKIENRENIYVKLSNKKIKAKLEDIEII